MYSKFKVGDKVSIDHVLSITRAGTFLNLEEVGTVNGVTDEGYIVDFPPSGANGHFEDLKDDELKLIHRG